MALPAVMSARLEPRESCSHAVREKCPPCGAADVNAGLTTRATHEHREKRRRSEGDEKEDKWDFRAEDAWAQALGRTFARQTALEYEHRVSRAESAVHALRRELNGFESRPLLRRRYAAKSRFVEYLKSLICDVYCGRAIQMPRTAVSRTGAWTFQEEEIYTLLWKWETELSRPSGE